MSMQQNGSEMMSNVEPSGLNARSAVGKLYMTCKILPHHRTASTIEANIGSLCLAQVFNGILWVAAITDSRQLMGSTG